MPPSKSLEVKETKYITTLQKPKLCKRFIQYLSKHISVNINKQCLIMKVDQFAIIPDEIYKWLINVLSFHEYYHGSAKPQTLISKDMQDNSLRLEMKLLFPKFDLTLNKADGVCMKASSNKEIVFIEVSGGPESTVENHVWEDTEKLIKEAMFGLVSLLRDYLDKNATNAKNIRTYMVQVIETLLFGFTNKVSSITVLPFSFDEVEKFLEIFELLYALLNGLEGQKNELKKLALTKPIKYIPTVRDWIWVPESIVKWKVIGILKNV
ncbi:13296_t:CDS:2 [Funneliformis geosporum]|uniref:13296_t:CDS:1 n=1 Tax=Funneliformis geosporum TaxID=1117311 RepID=A0A9W4SRC7_9GLOM|nr:13296_t:CDS:2 [Funneliformis geosporum]